MPFNRSSNNNCIPRNFHRETAICGEFSEVTEKITHVILEKLFTEKKMKYERLEKCILFLERHLV